MVPCSVPVSYTHLDVYKRQNQLTYAIPITRSHQSVYVNFIYLKINVLPVTKLNILNLCQRLFQTLKISRINFL